MTTTAKRRFAEGFAVARSVIDEQFAHSTAVSQVADVRACLHAWTMLNRAESHLGRLRDDHDRRGRRLEIEELRQEIVDILCAGLSGEGATDDQA